MARVQGKGLPVVWALLLLVCGWVPARADIFVSLQPDTLCISPSQQFTVVLTIDQAGSGFNGYAAVVRFDPGRLAFVSAQEVPAGQGGLIRGLCGASFWRAVPGPDSVYLAHTALCGPDSIVGPGPLSSITFRTQSISGVTEISFDSIRFLYAGYLAAPSVFHNSLIIVTPNCPATGSCCFFDNTCQALVPEDCRALGGVFMDFLETCLPNPCEEMSTAERETYLLDLRIVPNPSSSNFEFLCGSTGPSFGGPGEPGSIEIAIFDPQGRMIRRLSTAAGSKHGSLFWYPVDERGRRLPAGAYFATISVNGRAHRRTLMLTE